jgi:hypothetical protein
MFLDVVPAVRTGECGLPLAFTAILHPHLSLSLFSFLSIFPHLSLSLSLSLLDFIFSILPSCTYPPTTYIPALPARKVSHLTISWTQFNMLILQPRALHIRTPKLAQQHPRSSPLRGVPPLYALKHSGKWIKGGLGGAVDNMPPTRNGAAVFWLNHPELQSVDKLDLVG